MSRPHLDGHHHYARGIVRTCLCADACWFANTGRSSHACKRLSIMAVYCLADNRSLVSTLEKAPFRCVNPSPLG